MSDVPRSFSLDPEEDVDGEDDWPGPKKTWTTREQWRWLKDTRSPYLAAQRGKKLAKYLEQMNREWFVLWSECYLLYGHKDREKLTEEENDMLNEAVKKRKEQLRMWHRNRDRNRQTSRPLSALLAQAGVTKKTSRIPQKGELYSKERYKSDVQPAVRAKKKELEAELGRKWLPGERLNVVKQCTKEAYAATSTHVKLDIAKKQAKAKEEAAAERSGRALEGEAARTPQQYQDAIDATPGLLKAVMNPVSGGSGWTYVVVGAGPVPEDKGKIGTISAHFGHDPKSLNFAQATPDFEEKFVVPLAKFAKSIFPRDVQKARSIEASGTSTPPSGQASQDLLPPAVVPASSGESSTASSASIRHVDEEPAVSDTSAQRVSSHEVPSAISSGEAADASAQTPIIDFPLANPDELTWENAIRFDPNSTEPIEIDYSRMDDAALSRMISMFDDADPGYRPEFPPVPDSMVPMSAGPTSDGAPTVLPDPLMAAITSTGPTFEPTSEPAPTFSFPDTLGGLSPALSATQPTTDGASVDGADAAKPADTGEGEAEEEDAEGEDAPPEEDEEPETGVGRTRRSARESRTPRARDADWDAPEKDVPAKNARTKKGKQTLAAKPAAKPAAKSAAKPPAKRRAADAPAKATVKRTRRR